MPVSLTWNGDDLSFAWMTQALPIFSEPIADPARAAAALSLLAGGGRRHRACRCRSSRCGVPFLFVPLTTRQRGGRRVAESRGARRAAARRRDLRRTACSSFRRSRAPTGATAYSRMFAPGLGIDEDPATGSASGPLGCYLVRHTVWSRPIRRRRCSACRARRWGGRATCTSRSGSAPGEIASVRVGGEAVLAGEGTLYL